MWQVAFLELPMPYYEELMLKLSEQMTSMPWFEELCHEQLDPGSMQQIFHF